LLTRRIRCAGGSAANVITTLAQLGAGQAAAELIGVLGADATGSAYRKALSDAGVGGSGLSETRAGAPSGVSLCLVTPDGQRTMRTLLGAAGELSESHVTALVPAALLQSAQLLHCEGYALRKAGALLAAVRATSAAGGVVSLDLGSAEVVTACADALRAALATGGIDLVFCNESEAAALGRLAGPSPGGSGDRASGQRAEADAGVAYLLRSVQVVCLTLGAEGSVVTRRDGDRFATPARAPPGGRAIDTTGAGDAYAAGFLWALLHGAPLPVCAATGAAAAAEAVAVRGGALPPGAVSRVRAFAAAAGAGGEAPPAPEAPPAGLLASLGAWLWPEDAPDGAARTTHPAHRVATAAQLQRGAASTGNIWGTDTYATETEDDEDQTAGGALVETFDEQGNRVMMRRTLSGRLRPAPGGGGEHAGSFAAPYADGRLHRSLSSRVADPNNDSSASFASTASALATRRAGDDAGALLPSCGAPPQGLASYVAYYLGLGWLSAWVDSASLFAAPEEAPTRMRRSMSSRVMSGRSLAPGGGRPFSPEDDE
jgi:sugar/nucleoside kinase (ribokinase family)